MVYVCPISTDKQIRWALNKRAWMLSGLYSASVMTIPQYGYQRRHDFKKQELFPFREPSGSHLGLNVKFPVFFVVALFTFFLFLAQCCACLCIVTSVFSFVNLTSDLWRKFLLICVCKYRKIKMAAHCGKIWFLILIFWNHISERNKIKHDMDVPRIVFPKVGTGNLMSV